MNNETFTTLIRLYKNVPESFIQEVIIPQMKTAADVNKLMKRETERYIKRCVAKEISKNAV